MSWEATAWAMRKGKDYELEPVTRFVFLTLANYANREGHDIYPSLATLEGDTGLSERTIRRHIKTLIAVKLMEYGDQTVVSNNPRYRNDKLPKVYRFCIPIEGKSGLPDFAAVGQMPSSKHRPDKAKSNDRTQSPPAKPVDNSPENDSEKGNDRTESPERPDRESGTTGQTGGHRVHQTYNPPIEPKSATRQSESEVLDLEVGRKFREELRAKRAAKGITLSQARGANS